MASHLRSCPFCQTPPRPEMDGVIMTAEVLIDNETGEQICEIGYTARCCNCGASVSDEYKDNCVRLWNGDAE